MSRSLLFTIVASLLAGGTAHAEDNKIPANILAVLEKAEQFELFSLNPERLPQKPKDKDKDSFHGWKILGKTTVKNPAKLVEAFKKGVAANKGEAALCFNPRHGIRATKDGKTFDLVICFECFQVQAFAGEKLAGHFLIASAPQPVFDAMLTEAKIALPKEN